MPPAASNPALAEALLALGRLDGALAVAPEPALRLFAYRVVRRTLTAALASAGYTGGTGWFDAWLARRAGPPENAGLAEHPAEAVAMVVIDALQASRWAPLAEAAAGARRAASHLGRTPTTPSDTAAQETPPLSAALAEANAVIDSIGRGPDGDPLALFQALLAAAMMSPALAPAERSAVPLPVRNRVHILEPSAPRPASWLLGLMLGQTLCAAGLLRRPLPFPTAVPGEALRADLEEAERLAAFAAALASSAGALFDDLLRAHGLAARAAAALGKRRSTSRAPAVFEAIAGLGALRRGQVIALLGVTPVGADTMLMALLEAGLVGRSAGHEAVFSLRDGEPVAPAGVDPEEVAETNAAAEVDAAMAAIDAIVARTAS